MDTITKSPAEIVEHRFDFSTFGTINQVAISASQSGLTLVKATLLAGVLTLWVGGGEPDWHFELGARAIRTGGLQKEQRVRIEVFGPALDDIETIEPTLPNFPPGGLLLGPDALLLDASYLVVEEPEPTTFPTSSVLFNTRAFLFNNQHVVLA
jgi:hypothetical protein